MVVDGPRTVLELLSGVVLLGDDGGILDGHASGKRALGGDLVVQDVLGVGEHPSLSSA